MDIIKEYVGNQVVLRSNTYANNLAYFLKLFKEANKDFTGLDEKMIRVVKYGGQHYRHMMGIEFETVQKKPDCYNEINCLEQFG